ncbi:unnamed protein product [Caenorhabditis angaria]|uniref:Guanylate cyclase n=1 Tax=Caenorhabditis angaria TaxID=860376 RepID=A0A9P1MYB6_9PELO|nr:unnamed protein product [Caenorhabditis angaria]
MLVRNGFRFFNFAFSPPTKHNILFISIFLFIISYHNVNANPDPVPMPEALPSLGAGANPEFLDRLRSFVPNGTKHDILISYLAAIPTISLDVQNLLLSGSVTQEHNYKFELLSNCLKTNHASNYGSSGALVAAIAEINDDPDLLPNHNIRWLYGNTCGNESISTRLFMQHWQAGARLFVGPETHCKTEAAMATSQNLPMLSHACNDQEVSREDYHYSTFARTVPPGGEIFEAYFSLMDHFKWRKFSVIYVIEDEKTENEMINTLRTTLQKVNLNRTGNHFEIMNVSNLKIREVKLNGIIREHLKQTMDTTRIYLTFGGISIYRIFLKEMGDLGLFDKGYVLIYVDAEYEWQDVYHAMNNDFYRDTMRVLHEFWDEESEKMVEYSRNSLAIIQTPVKLNSVKFNNFWKKAVSHLHYFGVDINVKKDPKEKTNIFKGTRSACYLYDAVYLYARAVDELVKENVNRTGYDPTADGSAIIKKIVGKNYRSIQGFDMVIDEKGNSKGNFTVLSWQNVVPITNKSDTKYYPLTHALDVSATFLANQSSLPILFMKKNITWKNNEIPLDEPICGFNGEKCENTNSLTPITMSILGILAFFAGIVAIFIYRSQKFEKELSMIWRIDSSEIQRVIGGESTVSLMAPTKADKKMSCNAWFNEAEVKGSGMRGVAAYKGTLVALKEIVYYRKPRELNRETKKELRVMRQLAHSNINNFLGIIICPTSICTVREFCSKGSLLDILRNTDMKLDHLYIASFVEDLVKGMIYIHDSELKVHGNLKSTNCLITSRWALQIADYGLYEIRDGMHWDDSHTMWENFLWTAPESMTISGCHVTRLPPTQKSDVYSFGIILHEIFTRDGPYQLCINSDENEDEKMLKEDQFEKIVRRVYNDPKFRPSVKEVEAQNYIKDVMNACWSHQPHQRPDFKNGIRNRLKPLFTQIYKRNIMDHMILMMEKYQTQLEDLVEERTTELREEQQRSMHLLQRMLPPTVAEQLLAGRDVVPEAFPAVTIYFSDIVGFTSISGESTPMQVVEFLNKLYTLFDGIIRKYKVYKVETIGDAYMVVSGLPQFKCKEFHAEEMAMMSLHLLCAVRNFVIPHRPKEQLMIRIGLHTGPCVAGVVGKTMPRYTLFGDTVNTASRMESNGEALKIHCSQSTQNVLNSLKGFILEERGNLAIKGKGQMTTYWLNGRSGYTFDDLEDMKQDKDAEIFPRQHKIRMDRGSNWGINRDSTLSLAGEKGSFMKRGSGLTKNLDVCYYNSTNGGFASIGTSNREMPSVCEDDGESIQQPIRQNSRKRSSTSRGFATSRNFNSTISNAQIEHEPLVMRKRSTSLPDGEKLNLDFLEICSTNCSVPTIPTISANVPIATVAPQRAGHLRRSDTFDGSSPSDSPSNSQYPSYRDLTTPHQRKRGIATVYPMRKRSLSCGDALPHVGTLLDKTSCVLTTAQSPRNISKNIMRPTSPLEESYDDEKSLIGIEHRNNSDILRSCPQHRRKNKRSFLRDPSPLARRFREASPFGRKSFWNSSQNNNSPSRGDSITRLIRKWRGGNEYEDLNEYCEENGRVNRSISCSPIEGGNSTDNSEPLLIIATNEDNLTERV